MAHVPPLHTVLVAVHVELPPPVMQHIWPAPPQLPQLPAEHVPPMPPGQALPAAVQVPATQQPPPQSLPAQQASPGLPHTAQTPARQTPPALQTLPGQHVCPAPPQLTVPPSTPGVPESRPTMPPPSMPGPPPPPLPLLHPANAIAHVSAAIPAIVLELVIPTLLGATAPYARAAPLRTLESSPKTSRNASVPRPALRMPLHTAKKEKAPHAVGRAGPSCRSVAARQPGPTQIVCVP
jgi:hypothetical protein